MTKFSSFNPSNALVGVKGTALPTTRNSVLGDWNSIPEGTLLVVGDVVTYDGSSYSVKVSHNRTSGTTNPSANDAQYTLFAAGSVGEPGAPARLVYLISDRQVISYNSQGLPNPASQTTVFTVAPQNLSSETFTISMTNADKVAVNAASYIQGNSSSTITDAGSNTVTLTNGLLFQLTEPNFAAAKGTTSGVIVTVSHADGVSDKLSIVTASDGTAPYVVELSASSLDVAATSQGVTKAGQLPKSVNISVRQGTTGVTTGLTYNVTTSSVDNITAAMNGAVLNITKVDSPGWVDVEVIHTIGGNLGKKRVTLTRTLDAAPAPTPPPTTNSTGPNYPTSASNSYAYFTGITSVTYPTTPNTPTMLVSTGVNGQLSLSSYWEYYADPATSDTNKTYRIAAKCMYRVPGGSWADLTTESIGTTAASLKTSVDGPESTNPELGSGDERNPGTLNTSTTVTLTADTDYEIAFIYRMYSGNSINADCYLSSQTARV